MLQAVTSKSGVEVTSTHILSYWSLSQVSIMPKCVALVCWRGGLQTLLSSTLQ